MKRFLIPATLVVVTSVPGFAIAETRVTVSPAEQVVLVGESPQFTVRVEAVGSAARIIRFTGRDDLRVNYARLTVYQMGKPVNLVRTISDPGPIGDTDIVTLNPGQSVAFVHRGDPFPLNELPPGIYSAKVLFDSTLVGGDRVESSTVTLRVKAK